MSEMQNIQWFPGHMTKTRRKITESLKLVDAVAEIIDARIPSSSRNPEITQLIMSKPHIIIMNKCDMADSDSTSRWIEYYKKMGYMAVPVDCKSGKGLKRFIPAVREVLSDKINLWQSKGMKNRSIRIMVVGIPNVGKSSFINRMAGQMRAKTEDRPGVTKGNQWFTISKGFELLDTPGVLWPKFDDQTVGEKLAFTGAVRDQVVDIEQLACRLLELLNSLKKKEFYERFKSSPDEFANLDGVQMLNVIGRKRGMFLSGGEIDTERAAATVIDEFSAAKFGRITLELPQI